MAYIAKLYGADVKGSTVQLIVEHTKQSVFYGYIPLAGSPETIANTIEDLAVNGDLDGVLFTFPNFIKGLNDFNDKVHKLTKLRYAGLNKITMIKMFLIEESYRELKLR